MNCHNATNAVSDVHERLHGGIGDDIVHALPSGLCLAADVAHLHDPQLGDLYRRLMLERRCHHNHALCAVATHITDRICAILCGNRTHRPRHLDGAPVTAAECPGVPGVGVVLLDGVEAGAGEMG